MPFKKMEVTLKFPRCLHLLEKLLLAYVIVFLMPYNFCNHNIFISLKIAAIFKVDKVIAPPCIYTYIYMYVTKMRISCVLSIVRDTSRTLMFQYKSRFSITNTNVREFMNGIIYITKEYFIIIYMAI